MTPELGILISDMLAQLPENDPYRPMYETMNHELKSHLRLMRLAERLNESFGNLPDATLISKVIPPFIRFKATDKRAYSGEHKGRTREQVYEDYPEWYEVYVISDVADRNSLTRLTHLNSIPVSDAGFITLGNLREASKGQLSRIQRGSLFGAKTISVIQVGFARSNSEAS
jgi:hypothetical protein